MKYWGVKYSQSAHTICKSKGARLPLPQNDQANCDTYAALKGKV